MSWPLFINWHTPEYAAEAARLRASLERFRLPHFIECTPSLGSWQRNTCFKPEFIRRLFRGRGGWVCWVDADAEFVASPVLLNFTGRPPDLAYCERPLVNNGRPEAQLGMMFFGFGWPVEFFVSDWVTRSAEVYAHTDQTHFNNMVAEGRAGVLSRLLLPACYCVLPEDNPEGAVILQHQASRRLVSLVGSEPPPSLPGSSTEVMGGLDCPGMDGELGDLNEEDCLDEGVS